ncbi:transmembrane protein 256 homolog [Lucilia cuprina]|uniref:transmembrane protein 256 homolog n=1 Tax=Lucilia cuprina TaxID=7375 RepID=UPI000C71B312|nr:transmembrane protein 256 homolog [Lucilia cuprina]XP_046802354.1 transmembrane protein 256 homolog [Lucilia cuprina]KAI8120344.1 Transmembrane protein 256 like protein [Lucilia cuprina]
MSVTDTLHYLALGNPVSKTIIGTTASIFSKESSKTAAGKASNMSQKVMKNVMPPLWQLAGRNYNFVRLAGLSGASAVVLGAIGSHHLNIQDKPELRNVFETANRFHFFHSIALLGMPMAKYPLVSGSLMVLGTLFFSGTLYYRAFTGNKPPYARMAPLGGTCLILAWLSLLI